MAKQLLVKTFEHCRRKSSLELFRLRKTLNTLANKEGSHTELITMYVPPGKQISDAINMLRDEYGTASNIKSTTTRKNVQEAIVKFSSGSNSSKTRAKKE